MAVVLPRTPRRAGVGPRAAAALAGAQLAARHIAGRALLRLCDPHRAGVAQDRKAAALSGAALLRFVRACLRCAEQRRAGPGLRPGGRGSVEPPQRRRPSVGGANSGAVLVGDRCGADARLDDADHAGDLPGRHLALRRWPGDDRRDRDVHEPRRHADHQARAGGRFHQPGVPRSAAPTGILRRARYQSGRARPPGCGRPRARARPDRIQGRFVLL